MSDEAGEKAGKEEEGADRDQGGGPASFVGSPPHAPGPAEEAVEGTADKAVQEPGEEAVEEPAEASEATDEQASEDMPTLPPASRGSVVGLRWATLPLQRRGGRAGPGGTDPRQIGPERFETGPPTLAMPTVVIPVVTSEPQLRPEGAATADEDTIQVPAVGGATWLGGQAWVGGPVGGPAQVAGQDAAGRPAAGRRAAGRPAAGRPEVTGGPEEADGEARRPSRRRRRAVLMLAVIALVAAVAVGALVLAGGGSARRTSVRTLTPQVTFEGFLAESSRAHQLLAAAVSDACRPALPATTARQALIIQVSRAVQMRRSVLNGIASDRQQLLSMNGGPSLVNNLDDATSASLSVDQGYEAWLEDLQATGCYGAPTNDIHYRAATEASLPASVAKERVVATWAGVASRYDLPSWTAGQL